MNHEDVRAAAAALRLAMEMGLHWPELVDRLQRVLYAFGDEGHQVLMQPADASQLLLRHMAASQLMAPERVPQLMLASYQKLQAIADLASARLPLRQFKRRETAFLYVVVLVLDRLCVDPSFGIAGAA